MGRGLVLGTILGGVVLFFWGFLFHSVIPFANSTLHPFSNQDAVLQAALAGAPASGTYIVPNYSPDATPEQRKAVQEKAASGPIVLVAVRRDPVVLGRALGVQLGADLLAALFLTIVIMRSGASTALGRAGLLVVVALAGWAMRSLPSWNWFGFGFDYVLAELVDMVVGFFLAGLLISRFVPATPSIR
jgi:hypothetical protein